MEQAPAAGGPAGRPRSRVLLGILVTLLALGAARLAAPVLVPVTYAVFFATLFRPLQRLLARYLPRGLALAGALGAFLLLLAVFGTVFWFAGRQIADRAPTYAPALRTWAQRADRWVTEARSWLDAGADASDPGAGAKGGDADPAPARDRGANRDGSGEGSDGDGTGALLGEAARKVVEGVFSFASALVLVVAFLGLGLLETDAFSERLSQAAPARGADRRRVALASVARGFRRYVVVRTAVGLLTGTLVWAASLLVGLELAFLWGLINFVLNFVPTLGSILAVIPPTLFALVQYDPATAALVLAVVGGIQLVMGNWIDPLAQGWYLSLSPFVVLFSVVFWGWLWGIPGAFIGVPLTLTVALATREFERTRWIAVLLAGARLADER